MRVEIHGFKWLPPIKTSYEATDCDVTKERLAEWLCFRLIWVVYIRPRAIDE